MTNIFPSCQSHHATTLSSFLGSYAASVSLLNARLQRLRQNAMFCSRSLLCSIEAISRNAPYSTARSSPVRSTRPDFRTSPPSSIRSWCARAASRPIPACHVSHVALQADVWPLSLAEPPFALSHQRDSSRDVERSELTS